MTLSKSKIFLVLCLGFIGGVFLGRYLNNQIMAIGAMIFIILLTTFWSNKRIVIISLTGLATVLGAFRFHQDFRQNDLVNYYGQKIEATGVIEAEPDVRPEKVFLTVEEVVIEGEAFKSKILLNVGRYPEYEYGQKINFTGNLQEPSDAESPGEFSYKNYLSRYGVDAIMYYPSITVASDGGTILMRKILQLKNIWSENLYKILPEPQNAFLGGLLLGAKRSIPQDLTEAFSMTGTSHIIAVSGYNITIIAAGIDYILRRYFRKRVSFMISLIAIALFVIMTGASASVVRAGVMGSLLLVALNIGRVYAIANALAFTAVVMLVVNPQILHFDVGFQLSFAALLGIVYLHPLLDPYFQKIPKVIRLFLTATLAAQIATLPILLYNFGTLSLIAPIANVLVLPIVPLTMLFGFLAGITAFIHTAISLPFAWISWLLLTYIIKIVELLSTMPFAAASVHFSVYMVIIYYLGLGFILWKAKPSNFSNF